MIELNIGDRVRIKDRQDWPSPPGYRFAGAEGTVVKMIEGEETDDDFPGYIPVRIEKGEGDIDSYIGQKLIFREEDIEKI